MPTYQYVCTACGQDLEAVQSFSDAALTECPACAGKLRKKFGSVGVVFKGSGFYRNDSRSGNGAGASNPAGATADKSTAEKSDTSEKTSESKPAAAEKSTGSGDKAAPKKESSSSSSGSTSTAA